MIGTVKMLHYQPNLTSRFNDWSSKIGFLATMQLKGIPPSGTVLFNSNLPTVKAVALLQGNTSIQCEKRVYHYQDVFIDLRGRHLCKIQLPNLKGFLWEGKVALTAMKGLQFNSVAQSCPTLCDPMNRSTPGFPVYHQLLESTQTHVHRVDDAIQPSHPLLSPSPPALNLSQHQGLFQ